MKDGKQGTEIREQGEGNDQLTMINDQSFFEEQRAGNREEGQDNDQLSMIKDQSFFQREGGRGRTMVNGQKNS